MMAHAQNACSSSSVRLRPFPGAAVLAQILGLGSFRMARRQRLAAGGELLAGCGGRCRRQPRGRGSGEFPFRGGDQARAYRAGVRGSAGPCVLCAA